MKIVMFIFGFFLSLVLVSYVYRSAERSGCEKGALNVIMSTNIKESYKMINIFDEVCK